MEPKSVIVYSAANPAVRTSAWGGYRQFAGQWNRDWPPPLLARSLIQKEMDQNLLPDRSGPPSLKASSGQFQRPPTLAQDI
jgi:hypothetical protein